MSSNADASHPRYVALLELLRTADVLWNASRIYFALWDLSPSQFNVLNLLRLQPDGFSQTELGRRLITHRSNVTGLVDRLEKRGLVARRDVARDRRAYRVILTPSGKALLEKLLPRYYEAACRVWEMLPDKRVAEITTELHQVSSNAQRIVAETTSD